MDPNVCQLRITICTEKQTRQDKILQTCGAGMTRKLLVDVHSDGPQMHEETREKRLQEETHWLSVTAVPATVTTIHSDA